MAAKRRSLGKGLDALLSGGGGNSGGNSGGKAADSAGDANTDSNIATGQDSAAPKTDRLRDLPIDMIERGQYQPRRDFDPEALDELAASIKAQGVMQPIVVRPIGTRFEIIAGERRWRAAQLAQLDTIPATVNDVTDEAAIAMALIENIQREDLNPMEEAIALDRLQTEFGLTQQEVADAVGKSRSAVANLLRLNALEPAVRKMLEHRDLDMGHARCLVPLPGDVQIEIAREVVAKSLSVRQTEALVNKLQNKSPAADKAPIDPDIRRLETELAQKLGAAVSIQHAANGKGKLVLKYGSLDELDGILSHLR